MEDISREQFNSYGAFGYKFLDPPCPICGEELFSNSKSMSWLKIRTVVDKITVKISQK